MKRILSVIILSLTMLVLCACAHGAREVDTEFSCKVSVTGGELACEGELSVGADEFILTMTAPPTIAGISYRYQNGELRTSYNGLSTVSDHDHIPSSAIPRALYTSLSYLSEAAYQTSDGDVDTFSLPTPYGAATLTAKDGKPHTLTSGFFPYEFRFE